MYTEANFKKVVSGSKTQSRRVIPVKHIINWEPDRYKFHYYGQNEKEEGRHGAHFEDLRPEITPWIDTLPSTYQPGEVLYLKEPYQINGITKRKDSFDARVTYKYLDGPFDIRWINNIEKRGPYPNIRNFSESNWISKMFMPQKYARYFQKVTDVKVERVANISESDARAEGFKAIPCHCSGNGMYCEDCFSTGKMFDAKYLFTQVWNDINAYTWKKQKGFPDQFVFPMEKHDTCRKSGPNKHIIANPWVFAYTFELCDDQGNKINPK